MLVTWLQDAGKQNLINVPLVKGFGHKSMDPDFFQYCTSVISSFDIALLSYRLYNIYRRFLVYLPWNYYCTPNAKFGLIRLCVYLRRGRPSMVTRFQKIDFHCSIEWFNRLLYNVLNISVTVTMHTRIAKVVTSLRTLHKSGLIYVHGTPFWVIVCMTSVKGPEIRSSYSRMQLLNVLQ